MVVRRALALTAALAAVAGCASQSAVNSQPQAGTGTASPAAGGVQEITISAGVDLRFHPSTIVVHAGTVRLLFVNDAKPGAGPPHNIRFQGLPGVDVPDVQAGQEYTDTFVAPAPGTYDFECSIHAAQGQTGKLIVR